MLVDTAKNIGTLPPEAISFHEILFRDFLAFAQQKKLNMDWTLGLHFLKWAIERDLLGKLCKTQEYIIARVAFRWINAGYRDIDYKWIVISMLPLSPHWVVGQKSEHPHKIPRLFKTKPLDMYSAIC